MTVTESEHYRIPEPTFSRAIGQGDPPIGFTARRTNEAGETASITIEWGQVVKASARTDPDFRLGNTEKDPPLVRVELLQDLADRQQLEHVPTS